jgi:hypothetical protein
MLLAGCVERFLKDLVPDAMKTPLAADSHESLRPTGKALPGIVAEERKERSLEQSSAGKPAQLVAATWTVALGLFN